jgi:hypothetical protein
MTEDLRIWRIRELGATPVSSPSIFRGCEEECCSQASVCLPWTRRSARATAADGRPALGVPALPVLFTADVPANHTEPVHQPVAARCAAMRSVGLSVCQSWSVSPRLNISNWDVLLVSAMGSQTPLELLLSPAFSIAGPRPPARQHSPAFVDPWPRPDTPVSTALLNPRHAFPCLSLMPAGWPSPWSCCMHCLSHSKTLSTKP